MAHIGSRRWNMAFVKASKRAAKLGVPVYIAETVRSWEVMDNPPTFPGRRYQEISPEGVPSNVKVVR